MPALKIVLASPSPVTRTRLARALAADPQIRVLGQASDLSQAFTLSEGMEPDVVLVADTFFEMEEFAGMRSLFYALDARYLRIVDDPGKAPGPGRPGPLSNPDEPWIHPAMTLEEMRPQFRKALAIPRVQLRHKAPALRRVTDDGRQKLVVIGASTGGIDALLTILGDFPADCPPTAIVQHTGQGFSDSLIKLFSRHCAAEVVGAQDQLALGTGRICIAGGLKGHLRVRPGKPLSCTLREGPPVSGHLPSVDELFRSAVPLGPDVVGVILTGMGQDGAAGLAELRRAGAMTIGQDAATSTVYGMPKVAWDMGAVQSQLPLNRIAAEVLRAARRGSAQPMVAE